MDALASARQAGCAETRRLVSSSRLGRTNPLLDPQMAPLRAAHTYRTRCPRTNFPPQLLTDLARAAA